METYRLEVKPHRGKWQVWETGLTAEQVARARRGYITHPTNGRYRFVREP